MGWYCSCTEATFRPPPGSISRAARDRNEDWPPNQGPQQPRPHLLRRCGTWPTLLSALGVGVSRKAWVIGDVHSSLPVFCGPGPVFGRLPSLLSVGGALGSGRDSVVAGGLLGKERSADDA